MTVRKCIIDSSIFQVIPGLRVMVVIAKNLKPNSSTASSIQSILQTYWKEGAEATNAYSTLASHPHIQCWRQCYQAIGATPAKKFTSSVESLLKRAKKQPEPRSINPIVDLYNSISVKYIIPFGAFDIDSLPQEAMMLRQTTAQDTFMALDEDSPSAMRPNEVAYVCGTEVVTRHINWKQSKLGLVQAESENIIFMCEILKEVNEDVVEQLTNDILSKLQDLFNCEGRVVMLSDTCREVEY